MATKSSADQPSYEIALLEHFLDPLSYHHALFQYHEMIEQGIEPELAFLHVIERDEIA